MSAQKLTRLSYILPNCICRSYHGTSNIATSSRRIDLRSDTVTKPSTGMLDAMLNANVGDDVYKEDESVNKLEEVSADLFGMERALFVPSGTMGNLLCIMSHCTGRGEELIIGSNQHVYCYEQGHVMQFASIAARVLPNEPDGTICLKEISKNIHDDSDFHRCQTKLICLENNHMRAGGVPLSVEYMQQVGHLARSNNIGLHVDGARLYNAAVSLKRKVSDLLTDADSVSMCLSKGLGCPVGSVIGGTKDFIKQAQRIRKGLGGGMRQSGFLAAAGIYALEHAQDVLSLDHERALRVAQGIKDLNCPHIIDINMESVRSNMLFITTQEGMAGTIVDMLKVSGILCGAFDDSTIRFVTHLDVNDDDVTNILSSLERVVTSLDRTTSSSA